MLPGDTTNYYFTTLLIPTDHIIVRRVCFGIFPLLSFVKSIYLDEWERTLYVRFTTKKTDPVVASQKHAMHHKGAFCRVTLCREQESCFCIRPLFFITHKARNTDSNPHSPKTCITKRTKYIKLYTV